MTKDRVPTSNRPTRRRLLKTAAAFAGTTGALAMPALAQGKRTVKFTLPWLAQGATAYAYVADDQGMFAKRGIDIQISRGFGSLAAGQAIGNNQFEFGLVSASSTMVCAATGIPLVALATTNYDAYLGVLVRADSPIKTPKDLEGKHMGGIPSSVEFPLWRAFAKKAGVDADKVDIVQADPRVMERILIEKKIDAMFCVTSTSYATAKALNTNTRALLASDYGLTFYSNNIVTRPDVMKKDSELCKGVTDALLEALAFTLRDPNAALDIFLKKVPELSLSPGGREFSRLGQGFMLASAVRPESEDHGLGYSDMARVKEMLDLVMEYAVPPTAKRPNENELFTNQFIGSVRLTKDEWAKAAAQTKEFPALLA
jgi:NitT/TauT family transport system substrate-binding protein